MLASALDAAGLVCYEREWWHWSYGDDVWAAHSGRPARYGVWEQEQAAARRRETI